MGWPTPQDYNEAIQNPRLTFSDPELQTGTPELTSLGLPRPITGNFASVYRLTCPRRDWAVRCFWREFADLQERYDAISRHLEAAHLPYTVPFQYVRSGIRVRGEWYPVLKMEWIEGEQLGEYVSRHAGSPRELMRLAREWLQMVARLEDAGVAHGDLQHGNVLVANGELKLVDYDGMFVPALSGRGSHELGHQNYQHPLRTGAHFGPELDRFSAWVIYCALVVLSRDPGLLAFSSEERLLFDRADLSDPSSSSLLQTLQRHRDGEIRTLAAEFRALLSLPPDRLPPVRDAALPEVHRFRLPRRRTPASAAAVRTAPLPGWMAEGSSSSLAHLGGSLAVPRISTIAALLGLLTCSLAAGLLGTPPLDVGLGWASLTGLNLAVLGLWYLRHPAVVERRRVNRRERDELRALRQIRREVHRLEGRREKLEAGRQRRRDEHALRMRAEQERVQGRCDRIRAQFAELHGLLEMEVRAIKAEEASRLAALLERLQDGHAAGVRRAHRVWELSELHLWERAFLWLRGIRTASHLSEGGIDALHLDGKAAAAVLRWRLAVDAEVRRTMPKEVPPQQRIPLQERYARTRRKVEADRLRLQVEESALLTAVLEVFAERSAAWRTRTQGVDSWYEEQYAALDRAIEEARRPEPVHHWRLAEARRELDRFQEVTLRRYALSLVGL